MTLHHQGEGLIKVGRAERGGNPVVAWEALDFDVRR